MRICGLYKSPHFQSQSTLNHHLFPLLKISASGICVMANTVFPNAASAVQAAGILTLKDFQQKNGIGPWMSRVRIVRMWHETNFMKTNDVTTLDLLLLDDTVSSKLSMISSLLHHFRSYEHFIVHYATS
ncbi:hypothetical protein MKX03_037737 [Papaver bracteatum]|nr:hypothetical protein MKX03_037737 [Papaver bracteatum]